jgi:hypothetical protein
VITAILVLTATNTVGLVAVVLYLAVKAGRAVKRVRAHPMFGPLLDQDKAA